MRKIKLKLPVARLQGIFKCRECFCLCSLANPVAKLRGMRSLSIFIFISFILISFVFPLPSISKTKQFFKIVLSKKNDGYPAKFQKNLEHPYDISESVLKKIMKDLYYIEKKIGRGWNKKEKRVFTNSLADKASVRIKHALSKAGASQKIVLTIKGSKVETICDIFVKEGEINFKFDRINGISKIRGMWRMVPKLAQHYQNTGRIFSLSAFNIEQFKDRTWIRISLLELAGAANLKKPDP